MIKVLNYLGAIRYNFVTQPWWLGSRALASVEYVDHATQIIACAKVMQSRAKPIQYFCLIIYFCALLIM